jgi:hypothetical protein
MLPNLTGSPRLSGSYTVTSPKKSAGNSLTRLSFADGARDWPAFAASVFDAAPGAEAVAYHDIGA